MRLYQDNTRSLKQKVNMENVTGSVTAGTLTCAFRNMVKRIEHVLRTMKENSGMFFEHWFMLYVQWDMKNNVFSLVKVLNESNFVFP
jgi:hypothetical protein